MIYIDIVVNCTLYAPTGEKVFERIITTVINTFKRILLSALRKFNF